MQTPKPTLTLDETAAALSIRSGAFIRDRAALEAQGFPKPLPALRAAIWSRAQVTAWIAAGGLPPAEPEACEIIPFVAAQRAALQQRYQGAAK